MSPRQQTPVAVSQPQLASRLLPLFLAALISLASFVWLDYTTPAFEVTDDSIRDQLLVRDCTELDRCHLLGASASLLRLHHGGVWLDLLVAVRVLGGDPAAARRTVLVLLVLGSATVFLVTWQWLSPPLALPAAALFSLALSLDRVASQLTNASLAAFPDCLTVAALLCFALSGRRRFLLVASFALGAAINVHVGSLSLLPPFAMIAVAARPHPILSLVTAALALGATCIVTSAAALRANVAVLAAQGLLWPVLAASLAAVAGAAALGPRFRRQSPTRRAWTTGLMLLAPFGVAAAWAFLWRDFHFNPYYLHPVLAPLAVLASAVAHLPFAALRGGWRAARWLPTAATIAVLLAFFNHQRQGGSFAALDPEEAWSLAEVEAVTARARSRGWGFEDVLFRLQGTGCRDLVVRSALFDPPPRPPGPPESRQLQVIKAHWDAVGDAPIEGEAILLGESVAVMREIDSWLRPYALRACRTPLATQQPVCSAARAPAAAAPERFLFSSRAYPEIHEVDVPAPYVASYEVPLQPGSGESRLFALTAPGWQIARVDGVVADGPLPARRVELRSPDGRPGRLVVERTFTSFGPAPGDLDIRYPPCFFEARPGDPLLALLPPEP